MEFLQIAPHDSMVEGWNQIMEYNGIARKKLEGKEDVNNIPEEIATLCQHLKAQTGNRGIILMIDEAICSNAELVPSGFDWTALDKVPGQLSIILMFNPGFYHGHQLLLPASCLRLVLETTYRSTQRISNLHTSLATTAKCNAPPSVPGTEVVGENPGLVVMGNLWEMEEEEMHVRIKHGLRLMRDFMGTEDVTVVLNLDNYLTTVSEIVRETASDPWGWRVRTLSEMFGAEADRVVVIGKADLEAISRPRLMLGILLCYEDEDIRRSHINLIPGYRAAIENGQVVVAAPPFHPMVRFKKDNLIQFINN